MTLVRENTTNSSATGARETNATKRNKEKEKKRNFPNGVEILQAVDRRTYIYVATHVGAISQCQKEKMKGPLAVHNTHRSAQVQALRPSGPQVKPIAEITRKAGARADLKKTVPLRFFPKCSP